jgi:hypothetical protein
MKKSPLITISLVAAALSASASAHAGFVFTSASRSISMLAPTGTTGNSSSVFGTFNDWRSHSAPFLSGFVQQNSNLTAAEVRLTAFAQVSSSSAAFAGPLSGTSISNALFGVDRDSTITMSVTTTRNASAGGTSSLSVLVRDMTAGGTVLYTSTAPTSTTVTLTFLVGRQYQVDVTNNAAITAGTGSASANYSVLMTAAAVPSPGALALAGLALVSGVSVRRRR